MALPAQFSLLHSEFNAFLFAPVGEEGNGMPLSVVSALTRLDIDPWQEAARLSDLPKEFAAATLRGLIDRLPAGRWERADAQSIAARLIELLPQRGYLVPAEPAKPGETKRARLPGVVWAIFLVLGAAAFLGMATIGDLPWRNNHVSGAIPSTHSWE